MQVQNNCVVSIHFTLTNINGEVLDSSQGLKPLSFIFGCKQVVVGLEKNLLGAQAGDELNFELSPEEAYGEHQQDLILDITFNQAKNLQKIQVGEFLEVNLPQGKKIASLLSHTPTGARVDTNHPLAGQRLVFHLSVESVRPASEAEIHQGLIILPN